MKMMPPSTSVAMPFLALAAALCLALSTVAPLHVSAEETAALPPAVPTAVLVIDPVVEEVVPPAATLGAFPPDVYATTGGELPPEPAYYDDFHDGPGAPAPEVYYYLYDGGKGGKGGIGRALPPGVVKKVGDGSSSGGSDKDEALPPSDEDAAGGPAVKAPAPFIREPRKGGGGGDGESPDIPIVVIDDRGFLYAPRPAEAKADSPNVDIEKVEDPVPQVGAESPAEGSTSSSPPPPSLPSAVPVVISAPGGSASAPAPARVVITGNDAEEQAAAIEAFLKKKANGYHLLYKELKKIDFFTTLASGIDNGNKYTIVAPIDKSFKKFKIGKKLKIADVLAGHVITTGKLKYDAVFSAAADTALNTLLGTKVYKAVKLKKVNKVLRPRLLTKKANGKRRSLATVVVPDAFETTNVVVHGISKALRPSSAQPSRH